MEEIRQSLDKIIELVIPYSSKLLLAVFVLILGSWFISRVLKVVDLSMDRIGIEVTLQRFLLSFTNIALKVILVIVFASMIGVETASLIAVLGAAGLAVGLSLQGSLANLAGGVIILFFKPFKVGDVIEAQGYLGKIEEIQIFNTVMKTLDNQRVYIPNGSLSNGCVKNLFAEPTRRVDLTFGISYGDDIKKTRQVIQSVIDANPFILKEPKPDIFVSAHADSAIHFLVRPWCKSEDYVSVYYGMMEDVKLAFDREGITIPFPQRDVHIFPAKSVD